MLLRDQEILALFPDLKIPLLLATKSGRRDWVRLLEVKRIQQKTKEESEKIETAMSKWETEGEEIKESKELVESDKKNISPGINPEQEEPLEERIIGLLTFDLALKGKLEQASLSYWNIYHKEALALLDTEYERISKLFNKPLDPSSQDISYEG